jgi:hypothetical protein
MMMMNVDEVNEIVWMYFHNHYLRQVSIEEDQVQDME